MKTATRILLAVFAIALTASLFCSCDDVFEMETLNLDTVIVAKGYERYANLTHRWDSVSKTRVNDNMTSEMTLWRTADGNREVMFDDVFYPQFTVHSTLLWNQNTVNAGMLKPAVKQTYLHHHTDGEGSELDTVYVELADGQKIWYPVKITNQSTVVGNNSYDFGSLTLVMATYHGTTNQLVSFFDDRDVYNTTYKTTFTLKEKYVDNPQTFEVSVYAYATRSILKEAKPSDDVTITVKGRNRTPIDSLSERIRFKKVYTYKSGKVEEVEISTVLQRRFQGKNFSQQTYDFDYRRAGSNGITSGEERLVDDGINWTIYGREDSYGAPFENGIDFDRFNSHYSLYHQRAVYKDADITVEFGYEAIRIVEMETRVNKFDNTSAILYNRINAIYLGFGQDLENNVTLLFR